MGTALGALARQLQSFGGSIQDLGKTVYTVDARRKADEAQLLIADRIEEWKTQRLTDPDYGQITIDPFTKTPTFSGGYTEKWDALEQDIKQNLVETIDNPLAKEEVDNYFRQLATSQKGAVQALQFEKWGAATVTSYLKQNEDFDDKPVPVQTKLDHARENIAFLTENNLMDPEQARKYLETHSQVVIKKDLLARSKDALKTGELAAAERLIAEDTTSYTSGTGHLRRGDQVKDEVLSQVRILYNAIQDEADAKAQQIFYDFQKRYPERGVVDTTDLAATAETFQTLRTDDGFLLNAPRRQSWIDRLYSRMNGMATGSGTELEARGQYVLGLVARLTSGIELGRGNSKIIVPDPKDITKTIEQPISIATFEALESEQWVIDALNTIPGAWDKMAGYRERVYKPKSDAFPVLKSMDDDWNKWLDKQGADKAAFSEEYQALKASELDSGKVTQAQFWEIVQKNIMGPAFKNDIRRMISWDPAKIDNFDEFIGQMFDGEFANAFRRSGPGQGDRWEGAVMNPKYAPLLPNLEAIEKNLEGMGIDIGKPWIDTQGKAWYPGQPSEIKDAKKGAVAVSYAVFPFAEGNDRAGTRFRDIEYPKNVHVKQMLINDGEKDVWMDVLAPNEGENKYSDRYTLPQDEYKKLLEKRGKAAAAAAGAKKQKEREKTGLADIVPPAQNPLGFSQRDINRFGIGNTGGDRE